MQLKFIKKYDINFEKLYTAAVKKTKHIKFKYNFTKIMRKNTFKKLNY